MPESNMPMGRARSSAGSAARSAPWPAAARSAVARSAARGAGSAARSAARLAAGLSAGGESPHALLGRFAESEVYRIDPQAHGLTGSGSTVKPGVAAADRGTERPPARRPTAGPTRHTRIWT